MDYQNSQAFLCSNPEFFQLLSTVHRLKPEEDFSIISSSTVHRDVQQEQSKKGKKKEYTSERKRQFRLKKARVISNRPLKANDIYYKLRENLSPANQRLLDILTSNTEEDTAIPF
jgi:hypothetical protein